MTFLLAQADRHGCENKKLDHAVSGLQQGKKLPHMLHDLHLSGRSQTSPIRLAILISRILSGTSSCFQA